MARPPVDGTATPLKRQWQVAAAGVVVLIAAVLLLYRDTAWGMVTIWARSETFTHGFLVPPIVLWLVWRKRAELTAEPPRPFLPALLAMAGLALMWLLGDLAAVNAVTQLSMTGLLVTAVLAVIGWRATAVIAFPLGFLFFAVPIGEFLLPQLMEWTANFTIIALRLSGIPVYRDGLQFVIPSGNWSVVEACSGVRYLIASLTVGTLFAYLNYESNRRRWIFVGVSILVPIVANWMRAYMIVMLGHYSGNTLAVGVDHLIYGWLFFGLVIMLMFMIGARWAEPPMPARPLLVANTTQSSLRVPVLWLTVAGAAALVALPQVVEWKADRANRAEVAELVAPPSLSNGWSAVPVLAGQLKPAFRNPSREMLANYRHQDTSVGLYLGYYRNQDYTRKLVSSDNVLVTSKDPLWAQAGTGERVATLGTASVTLRTADLRNSGLADQGEGGRLVVWQFYWLNGEITSSDYKAKAYSAFHRLLGQGDDAAVVVVSTLRGPDNTGEAQLESFMRDNFSAIDALLHKTRGNP